MVDFLIIGQGLAGSLLAWELIQRGCTVVVADNGQENASKVAAGLINPITGMRFVKSADTDTLLPAARSCYSNLSTFFGQEFFIEKPMVRIFRSEKELINAERRLKQVNYRPYLNNIASHESLNGNILTPYGFLEQKQTGYLVTRPLLNCLREFFVSRNSYRKTDFDFSDIKFWPNLQWHDLYPGRIIFCEGYQAMINPWFSWLPFQPVKGEILTMEHQLELPNKILNYGNWLIPLNPRQIRIGATFDRENRDILCSEDGKNALLEAVGQLSSGLSDLTLIDHQAGIRPCTADRQPFIGSHPEQNQLTIFNGFGAKGSLQIPWYSRCLADHLMAGALLPPSCNIDRYYKKYFERS